MKLTMWTAYVAFINYVTWVGVFYAGSYRGDLRNYFSKTNPLWFPESCRPGVPGRAKSTADE